MLVEGSGKDWKFYYYGNEGKRHLAHDIVAPKITENEIELFLADLFHEFASPEKVVVKIEE